MIQTLSDALAERGYDVLTPVQEAVTDPALDTADLLVSAQTGSGKTVGFGLAIGPTILSADGAFGPAAAPLALIVAPTRELAFQVTRELDWLYARAGARVVSCVGGMDMRDERRALDRGAHVVVGTPGRLRDHIQRGSLDMGALRAVVLDEADEMLDLGFREDLEFMLGQAPAERRTLMFSATVPPVIATLAANYQREAVRVTTLSDRAQHADIAYQALRVAQTDTENAIINVLRYHEAGNAIVFANTRATVNRLTARFANRGFAVVCLSGELSQAERSHALQAMRDGRARVCVATDVAARGIDLPNLELVIHAELPSNAEGLLHRSGRTGRAGRKGISALVVPPKALKRAERLLQSARVTAEWTTAPGAEEIRRRDEDRLLSDPAWAADVTEAEAAFAERLLAAHAPRAIAAACLRLYRRPAFGAGGTERTRFPPRADNARALRRQRLGQPVGRPRRPRGAAVALADALPGGKSRQGRDRRHPRATRRDAGGTLRRLPARLPRRTWAWRPSGEGGDRPPGRWPAPGRAGHPARQAGNPAARRHPDASARPGSHRPRGRTPRGKGAARHRPAQEGCFRPHGDGSRQRVRQGQGEPCRSRAGSQGRKTGGTLRAEETGQGRGPRPRRGLGHLETVCPPCPRRAAGRPAGCHRPAAARRRAAAEARQAIEATSIRAATGRTRIAQPS